MCTICSFLRRLYIYDFKMRVLIIVILAIGATHAQDCDIPTTCSDNELDDDAAFDATIPFPTNDFTKDIKRNETMMNIINILEPSVNDLIPTTTLVNPSWTQMCPVYHYTIYRWSFWDQQYGRCFALQPIHATRCASRYCKYVIASPTVSVANVSPFVKYYRCFPYYRKVFFWAYCMTSSNEPRFFLMSRYIAGGCNCRRYLCPIPGVVPPA